MRCFQFDIQISPEKMLRYYQGVADTVVIHDRQGRVLHIHPRYFRQFMTPNGIQGSFELRLDEQGRFNELVRI